MTRLLLAELNRLRSRRFAVIALIAVLLLLGAFQLITNAELKPPSQAEVAQAEQIYNQQLKDWEGNHEEQEKQCTEQGAPADECAWPKPTRDEFVRQPSTFAAMASIAVTVTVFLIGLIFFFIGASFIGAEYTSGSLANWLTFIPNRWKVFTSKIVAVAVVAAVATAVAVGLMLASTALLASRYDSKIDGWSKLLAMAGRGVLLGILFAVLGFCLALVTRHTAAAIGVVLGYVFLTFVRSALGMADWVQKLNPWVPENNLLAILDKGYRYSHYVETITPEGRSYEGIEKHISLLHGSLYWAVIAVVAVVVAVLVFRRRDVT